MLVYSLLGNSLFCLFLQTPPDSNLQWTFDTERVGGLPIGWETRGATGSQQVYQISAEVDGNRYLAAHSRAADVQVGVEISARSQDLPILSWRWRAWELPRGADERNLKTLDSAASVYAVFGSRLFPRILKYVWSTSVPVGTSLKHPSSSRMAILVVNSGPSPLGEWVKVSRNLLEDYKAAFGSQPGKLIALGIKTDSDSTRTSARADYDDIQLSRR